MAVGVDRADRRLATHFDAEVAAGVGESVGEAAHAALHVAPHAAGAAGLAHHVVQQHVGAAGGADRRERADDGVGGERGPQDFGFEPALEDRAGGAGEQLDRVRQVGAEPLERAMDLHHLLAVAQALGQADSPPRFGQRQRVGGRVAERRFERGRDAFEQRVVARVRLGVARAELGDLALVERRVRCPASGCGHRAAA